MFKTNSKLIKFPNPNSRSSNPTYRISKSKTIPPHLYSHSKPPNPSHPKPHHFTSNTKQSISIPKKTTSKRHNDSFSSYNERVNMHNHNLPMLSKSVYFPLRRFSYQGCFSKILYIDKHLQPTKFYYLIRPENGGNLVKKCFQLRTNWNEIPYDTKKNISNQQSPETQNTKDDISIHSFNFRWQETIRNIDYSNLSRFRSHIQIVNHFEFHNSISNKTNLFINLFHYAEWNDKNIFKYIPMTIIFNYEDPSFLTRFENFSSLYNTLSQLTLSIHSLNSKKNTKHPYYRDYFPFPDRLGGRTRISVPDTHYNGRNLWLVKAPDLNRGRCIKVVRTIKDLQYYIKCFHSGINKGYKTPEMGNASTMEDIYHLYKGTNVIVQKYIESPMLYKGRKFDIRTWVLLTHKMDVFLFREGHLKICSVDFDLDSSDAFVHLTNYSFQKHNANFSKYEYGNEVSFQDLQEHLDEEYAKSDKKNEKVDFFVNVIPKMKEIIEMVFKSVKYQINKYKRKYSFEIFGFDFMLDRNALPFLIEVNSNPGLEESSPLIKMLLPRMLDDAFRLTVDDIFETKYTYYKDNTPYTCDSFDHSAFEVSGYSNHCNMWEYICSIQE